MVSMLWRLADFVSLARSIFRIVVNRLYQAETPVKVSQLGLKIPIGPLKIVNHQVSRARQALTIFSATVCFRTVPFTKRPEVVSSQSAAVG